MPDTTTPAPVAARPPFTGGESPQAINLFVARNLNVLAGRTADGRERFEVVPAGVRYVESGLVFSVEKNYAGRGRRSYGGTVNGVTPYRVKCDESDLNPAGATGAHVEGIDLKLHANGEGVRWEKLYMVALMHAQRKAEAAARQASREERRTAAWARLATYMAEVEAHGEFVAPPTTRGSLDPVMPDNDRARMWSWHTNVGVENARENVTPIPFCASFRIALPRNGYDLPDDWTPEKTEVYVKIGFEQWERASHAVTLREAIILVGRFLAMAESYRAVVAPLPRADEASRSGGCPQCGGSAADDVPVHDPHSAVAIPADGRRCVACGHHYIVRAGAAA